jgi:periplasmic divalent cation tolerance protein
MDAILILTTADHPDLAQRIASALVENGEAACVNILPAVRSIYRWQGKLCDEGEQLLLIKSVAGRFEAVRSRIRRLHTYEVPEVIAVPITAVDADFGRWMDEQLRGPA